MATLATCTSTNQLSVNSNRRGFDSFKRLRHNNIDEDDINGQKCLHVITDKITYRNYNSANHLKFSIENILRKDFGKHEVKDTHIQTDVIKVTQNLIKEPIKITSDNKKKNTPMPWPAWVYCTRYSDRPSSGPRARCIKNSSSSSQNKQTTNSNSNINSTNDDKRPRTAFSRIQLIKLKNEFTENRYLSEKRRQSLSIELGLNEAQIKIWFQNKRAKAKKASGHKNPLALQLMAQDIQEKWLGDPKKQRRIMRPPDTNLTQSRYRVN